MPKESKKTQKSKKQVNGFCALVVAKMAPRAWEKLSPSKKNPKPN